MNMALLTNNVKLESISCKREDQCSAFKTPFSGRFNSEARVDRPSERKREEKEMKTTGGWSSPLLANGSLLPDKRIAKQKQLRVGPNALAMKTYVGYRIGTMAL